MHFGGGFPPQIVVALQNDLFARQRVDQRKIAFRFRKVDAPRNIPAQNNGVLRRNKRTPVFDDLFRVPLPPAAENIHRLGYIGGKVQISKRIKRHYRSLSRPTVDRMSALSTTRSKRGVLPARAASGAGAGTPVS